MKVKKNKIIIAAVVTVIAVVGIVIFNLNIRSNSQISVQADTNSSEYKQYDLLKAEEYDRMFLGGMIAHHQGAVEMANLAIKNASHQEIKDLATSIVSSQTGEITNMIAWQKAWGYPASSGEMITDHSFMGMENTNAVMMAELKNKSGEDFDMAFLIQMIAHHQSAINMAAPGKSNAQHQEVKDLTVAIITAQTKEIIQMKQWQEAWGYSSTETTDMMHGSH